VGNALKRNLRNNKKGMSIVISTIIIVAISITMAIAVSFWAMGIGNSFTRFEKLEFISVYAADTPVPFNSRQCYRILLQLKNTGTNTATINNIFLDGKPYNAQMPTNRVPGGILAYQAGIIAVSLQTGQSLGGSIYLPVGGMWNSGDYVALEIETSAGRHYPYTTVLP
jgi:archaeal type IV pilus assembly protein PilA